MKNKPAKLVVFKIKLRKLSFRFLVEVILARFLENRHPMFLLVFTKLKTFTSTFTKAEH